MEKMSFLEGQIAYEIVGNKGPFVIAIPGIGDLRSSYRHLAPLIAEAGYRMVLMDLRGHGDSSLKWNDYSSYSVGFDVVALIDHLHAEEVYIIGNSIGGAASVVAAAERPEQVKGIVMLNPFVRHVKMNPIIKGIFRLMLSGPWGDNMWMSHYDKLHITKPEDFNTHANDIKTSLKRDGRLKAFRKMLMSTHAAAEKRIPEVKAPVTIIMGLQDADMKDPFEQLKNLETTFNGSGFAIENAGHYVHAEQPELVAEIFLKSVEK
ncbi:alpha/beta hydrolase [bacterium]|nr:alpha/beta hydrolase [bacterium]